MNIVKNLGTYAEHKGGPILMTGTAGRKLPGVWKLHQLGPQGTKSRGSPRPGYENVFLRNELSGQN